MKKIAIFASGRGSNAAKIVDFFNHNQNVASVELIVSNKKDALVLEMAKEKGIRYQIVNRQGFYQTKDLLNLLYKYEIDLIVLAGFLWLVPKYLIEAFQANIINIHPALLPKFGGKGMYGMNVHKAVKAAGEKESGITIHYVNEAYDEGNIIFQASCRLEKDDTPEDIALKVQQLEHVHFAPQIAKLLQE